MKHFIFYSKEDVLSRTRLRKFETRVGERIQCIKQKDAWIDEIQKSTAKYILFGVPEDIGIRANHGKRGVDIWFPFLSSFLNIQSNDLLTGENIMLLGHFDFSNLSLLIESNAATAEEKIEAYRHAVISIDSAVEELVKVITQLKKIPVIIGGGHNNAYPAIKGTAKGLYKAEAIPLAQLNCINLDAHAEYRPLEGRHNGNAFRYADEDGYLSKYCMIGLHENYLEQNVLSELNESPFIDYITYEDIFIHEKKNFIQAIAHATGFTEDTYTGIEIDMDCVQNGLGNGDIPCGLTALQVRQFITFVGTDSKVAYVHICAGAAQLDENESEMNHGKLANYLVSDFIKVHSARG